MDRKKNIRNIKQNKDNRDQMNQIHPLAFVAGGQGPNPNIRNIK